MLWPKLLILAAACSSFSCQFRPTEKNMAKAAALLNPRREASLVYWQDKTLRGKPAVDFSRLITAIVLPPHVHITCKLTFLPGGGVRYHMNIAAKGSLFAGSAVPITPDGYFLTAAHCVESGPDCTLLALANDETMRTLPARVVWKGGNSRDQPDLALIHAKVTPHTIIAMAPLDALRPQQSILTSGVGSNGFPKLKQGESGGRMAEIGTVQEKSDGAKWLPFSHTAPLAPGDSGGPVIGEDGKLVGINTAVSGAAIFPLGLNQIWRYRGTGEAPDPAWIQSLIEQDRKERRIRKKGPS